MQYNITNEQRCWAVETFNKLNTKLSAECARMDGIIPYIPYNDRYKDMGCEDLAFWTNGFWGGILWQMYCATKDNSYRQAAETLEARLDKALDEYEGLHHDVGFMWLHTSVANYRLCATPRARVRALHAVNLLAGRFNPNGSFISAWNENRPGWMIIDSMMNMPLLYWATKESGDPRFQNIARLHIDTVIRNLIRSDGSAHHIAVADPATGELLEHPMGQGYASGSSWSRGQAWTIYGFALAYHHLGDKKYLDTAKSVAHYFIANVAQTRWIPRVDFRAPVQTEQWDSTAAVCAACGMLEISECVDEHEKQLYLNAALSMLRVVDEKFCDWDPQHDGIVGGGTVAYHRENETNVPIIYGDYFLVEAINRLLEKGFLIW